jgi:SAM-dependent methyltransferase
MGGLSPLVLLKIMKENLLCPVCHGGCALLDVVDFNKSCEELRGRFFALSGQPIYYALCGQCGFCFAPAIAAWTLEEFAAKIYNDGYALVDPDYSEARPKANAAHLTALLGERAGAIRHLDYGGGNGLLSQYLRQENWQSLTYDPFVDGPVDMGQLGKFDLITAFEVFEHVPDPRQLMANLRALLAPDGVILFSTLVSDDHILPNKRLGWWYASPRNGHISLFSKRSLAVLAQQYAVNFGSFSAGFHVFFTTVPPWAAHFIRVG